MIARPASRRADAGYTLLEVLIALSIIGSLSLALVANVGLGARVWERADRASATIATGLALERLLAGHLARAVPVQVGEVNGRPVIYFEGTARRMRFFADVAIPTVGGGIYGLDILISTAGGRDAAIELRRGFPGLGKTDPGVRPQWDTTRIGTGTAVPRFAYFGPIPGRRKSGWQREWRRRGDLPRLVRIELTPPDVDNSANVIVIAPALDWAAVRAPAAVIEDYFAALPGS